MHLQEKQVVAKKSELLFGMTLGDSTTKGDEKEEGVEPDELGIRMVEHGERVSTDCYPQN